MTVPGVVEQVGSRLVAGRIWEDPDMTTLTTYRRTDGNGWTYNIIDLVTGACLAFGGGHSTQRMAAAAARIRRDELLHARLRGTS